MTSDEGLSPPPGLAPALHNRRAVILLVDIVESVRLMEADEAGVIARWQAFLDHLQHDVLPATRGRLVKSLGDGLIAEFESAPRALAAAQAMHRWMAERCAPLADGARIRLRAGLHVSNVYAASDDLYGAGVNLVARVTSLAGPGETVATVAARDQLNDSLDADVEDLGDCHLKHVKEAVRVYRLGPAQQPSSLPDLKSYGENLRVPIAVIPFSDPLAAVPSPGLGDVVADGINARLSRSQGLHVVSRLSTACFREREAPLDQIGARLGVRYVVSGTALVAGDSVTLSVELAETAGGQVLWSDRQRARVRDLLEIDSAPLHEIADAVHRRVLDHAVSQALTRPLPTLASAELLVAGIAMMHRAAADEFAASARLLETLAERHPRIALPHAWLGKWYVLRAIRGGDATPAATAQALQHTARALDLEPSNAQALAMAGFVHLHLRKDLDTAGAHLQTACALNPSEGLAWLFMAVLQAFRGDGEAAFASAGRAMALSPVDPLRYYYESLMASCALSAGRAEEAVRWGESSLRRNRLHLSTLRGLIGAHVALGRIDQARQVAAALRALAPHYTVATYEAHSVAALHPFGQQIAAAMRLAGVP